MNHGNMSRFSQKCNILYLSKRRKLIMAFLYPLQHVLHMYIFCSYKTDIEVFDLCIDTRVLPLNNSIVPMKGVVVIHVKHSPKHHLFSQPEPRCWTKQVISNKIRKTLQHEIRHQLQYPQNFSICSFIVISNMNELFLKSHRLQLFCKSKFF